jgi:peptide methionine sulfoxide reductase MsrB
MQLSDEEWHQKLTPEQYRVLREKGTETPFSGDPVSPTGKYCCIDSVSLKFMSNKQESVNG